MPFIVDDIAVAAVTAEAATAATGSALAVEATGSAVAVEAATAATGATAIEATATAELTEAAESTVASEVTTALDVVSEGSSLADIPNLEGDLICQGTDRTIDLSDATFVDEFPHGESAETTTNIGGIDENVFYDEFPSEVSSESTTATDNNFEVSKEFESPKSYEELCETRNCGGSYKDLKNEGWGWNDNPPHEVHHMPADSVSHIEREDGPAIAIDYEDHQQTASCGSSREAKEYRAMQKELIDNGDFRGALQMDIDDLHDKFGDKYDEAISQMLDYVDKLEQAGNI